MSDSEEEIPVQHVNIVFIGEPNVGKTSLIRRFCSDEFQRQYATTTGADFYIKRLLLPTGNGSKRWQQQQEVVVKLVDIGGNEQNAHMLDNYLFKADMIVLMYDITNSASLEGVLAWIETISSLITSPPLTALVGTKCDLEHQRAVRLDSTRRLVDEHALYSYLTSAKTGEAVHATIVELVARYVGAPLACLQHEAEEAVLRAELAAVDKMAAALRYHSGQRTKATICVLQ